MGKKTRTRTHRKEGQPEIEMCQRQLLFNKPRNEKPASACLKSSIYRIT